MADATDGQEKAYRPELEDNPINDATKIRSRAWRVFFEASGRLDGVLQSNLRRRFGLSLSDYNILLTLWEARGHVLRMGELADRVVYSPSRLSYLVTQLVKDGLVRKERASGDKRGFVASLTEQGEQTFLKATRLHQRIVREYLLDALSDDDISQIVRIFGGLDSRLRGEPLD